MKIIFIFIVFIVLIICEIDRNRYIPHRIINYYVKNFPIQIYNGLHNTLYTFLIKKYIYDITKFEIYQYMKKHYLQIREEFFKNYKKEEITIFAHDTTNILKKDYNYSYIQFKQFNIIKQSNIIKFPSINILLKKFTNIRTAFISIIKGHKVIPFHRGPYNGVLRCHFPIHVDNPRDSYIQVMDKKLFYDKPFIFDDTYPHKFVKSDKGTRVVLILDVDNPYSPFLYHQYYY